MDAGGQAGGGVLWQPRIRELFKGVGKTFEEDIILQEFISIVDNVNSTLIIVERYKQGTLPVLIKTFVYNSLSRLNDLVRRRHGCIGKAMNYAGEELRRSLNKLLKETDPLEVIEK